MVRIGFRNLPLLAHIPKPFIFLYVGILLFSPDMKTDAQNSSRKKSPAKYVAGILLLAIVIITAIKSAVLYPPFLAKNQCYLCFRQATHSTTYVVVGQPGKDFDLKFCEKHGGPQQFSTHEDIPGRGGKMFLMGAMTVLSLSFLWGNYKIFFKLKPSPLSFWLYCIPLFLLLLGITFYLLNLEIAGRIISWITLSLLMFIWAVILFDSGQ